MSGLGPDNGYHGPGSGTHRVSRPELITVPGLGTTRVCLAAIAVFMAPAGLQATVAPRSFFEDFPVGRGWVAAEGGAYDEHLVRDVGVLFLALIVVTLWAAWRGEFVVPVAAAWLIQGIGHFAYHVGHLDGLAGVDRIGLVVSLAAIPVLAAAAIIAVAWTPARRVSR